MEVTATIYKQISAILQYPVDENYVALRVVPSGQYPDGTIRNCWIIYNGNIQDRHKVIKYNLN